MKSIGELLRPSPRGIPTTYKGVRFRSRLEAHYAAFFDSIGWPWQYEPLDLHRTIPDFVITFAAPLLVEVKPSVDSYEIAQYKLEQSGWEGEALVVAGAVDGPCIGRILERSEEAFLWSEADMFFCISCGQVSVHSGSGDWRCRCCGIGGDNSHVGTFEPRPFWVGAANRVQWFPDRKAAG